MSFKQEKVDKVSNQSRGIFDTFIYKTDDTCAEVSAAGYFSECRFAINDPESWNNSIMEVLSSDCFTKGIIDNAGNYVPLIGIDVEIFCTPLALTLAPVQQFTTTIINGSDVVFSGTSDGGDPAVSGVSVDTFQLLGGDVWFEWTITSANANAGIGNCPNAFIAPPPFAEGVIVVVNAAGTEFEMYKCSDIFAASPPIVAPQNPDFINKTLNFPYTVQTRMNGTTGEITWEDTNGNSGSLGLWTAILTANLDITMIGFGNTLALTQVDASYSVNAGRAAPVITPPLGFDTWCSYAPVPPPILCGSLLPLFPLFGAPLPVGVSYVQDDTNFEIT
ncbi:MAG TPA: hypothetical protein VMV86_00830, partial [Methanosarcinales archaeon]|nr:hypothetical protein [Methanosarcinales archaeon]